MIRSAQARAARKRYRELAPVLNEQSLRRFVALEAQALGRGGVSLMARISGLARSTIYHGLSDIRDNVSAPAGRISVGTDHDTATFAVNAIRRWWRTMGMKRHPKAKRLMITADGGGSNGYRVRLWKVELQKLADQLKLPITVCHLPPGTSKWNKIEHRLFSFISINWRGKPLRSYRTIVQLIAATTTEAGLTVRAELDEKKYPKGLKVSDAQLATVNMFPHDFHGEWNYTIAPNRKRQRK